MNIYEISKEINDNANAKGFWDNGVNVPEKLMLIVSEISEAMEADRKDMYFKTGSRRYTAEQIKEMLATHDQSEFETHFKFTVKDSFEDELADAAIRIFDLAFQMGINLEWHIQQKVRFNQGRPKMHGGKKY